MSVIEKISISSNQLTINYEGIGPEPSKRMYSCSKDDGFCYEGPIGKMTAEECNNRSGGCNGRHTRTNATDGSQNIDTATLLTWYG